VSAAPFVRKHLALPLVDQLIAFAWFVLFVAVGMLVLLADRGLVSSSFARLLRGNPDALAPKLFGTLMIVTGLGTLLRARLGGVVIDEDRITTRTSTVLGLPRVHMAYFAELRGASLREGRVEFVQFDGSTFVLPRSANDAELLRAVKERLEHFHLRLVDVADHPA